MFQSRNRETYDSNFWYLLRLVGSAGFQFQSRNRETYDSNFFVDEGMEKVILMGFNLVIEKLMIPT